MNLKDLGYLGKEIEMYSAMLKDINAYTKDRFFAQELAAALESMRLKRWLQLRDCWTL